MRESMTRRGDGLPRDGARRRPRPRVGLVTLLVRLVLVAEGAALLWATVGRSVLGQP
jgi:hypothetical protein